MDSTFSLACSSPPQSHRPLIFNSPQAGSNNLEIRVDRRVTLPLRRTTATLPGICVIAAAAKQNKFRNKGSSARMERRGRKIKQQSFGRRKDSYCFRSRLGPKAPSTHTVQQKDRTGSLSKRHDGKFLGQQLLNQLQI